MLPRYLSLALACAPACTATAPAVAHSPADLPCQGSSTVDTAESDFMAHDAAVITPKAKTALVQPDTARCLFYNYNCFMSGSGEIWFGGTDAHNLRISQ